MLNVEKTWEQIAGYSVKSAFLNPAAAFALWCIAADLVIGMLCMPFSKGIVIGSYNGIAINKESHESVREIILRMQDGDQNYEEKERI